NRRQALTGAAPGARTYLLGSAQAGCASKGLRLAAAEREQSRIPSSYSTHKGSIIIIILTGSEGVRTIDRKAITRIACRRFSRYSETLTSEIFSRKSITRGS